MSGAQSLASSYSNVNPDEIVAWKRNGPVNRSGVEHFAFPAAVPYACLETRNIQWQTEGGWSEKAIMFLLLVDGELFLLLSLEFLSTGR